MPPWAGAARGRGLDGPGVFPAPGTPPSHSPDSQRLEKALPGQGIGYVMRPLPRATRYHTQTQGDHKALLPGGRD